MFMAQLDGAVVVLAMPSMGASFHVPAVAVTAGITSYLMVQVAVIPASGWIADRWGARRVFAASIVLFALTSVLCATCTSVAQFTMARALQGAAAAIMTPVSRIVLLRATPRHLLLRANTISSTSMLLAPTLGPALGGLITEYASWRWIFLLNVPFGLAAMAIALVLVPNLRGTERKPLDMVGLLLSGATLTAILYGAELASQPGENPWVAGAIILGGLLMGVVAFQHAKRHPHPLVDVSTLKIPTFSVTVVTGSFTRIGIGAVPYLMPLLFQVGFGLSAFKSGLLLLASALGNLGMKALTTRILQRYGFRMVSIVDVTVAGVFIIACGLLTPNVPLVLVLFVVFVYGVARSMQFSTLATLAYADVAQPQMSAASTLWSAAAQMTIGLGIAFGAVSLRAAAFFNGETTGRLFTLDDFRLAFLFAGVVTLVSVTGYMGLARNAGQSIGGGSRGSEDPAKG